MINDILEVFSGEDFSTAFGETLVMVSLTILIGGIAGLALGTLLYTTRENGVLSNKFVYTILNILVNFVRPIPFIILIAAIGPLTRSVIGTTIGTEAAVLAMSIAATFGVAHIVEQNLVSPDPGVIEAARAMGASPTCSTFAGRSLVKRSVPGFWACVHLRLLWLICPPWRATPGGGGLGYFAIT